MGVTLVLAVVGTVVIAMIVKAVIGLRPTIEDEETGLDETDHGEVGLPLRRGGGLTSQRRRKGEEP